MSLSFFSKFSLNQLINNHVCRTYISKYTGVLQFELSLHRKRSWCKTQGNKESKTNEILILHYWSFPIINVLDYFKHVSLLDHLVILNNPVLHCYFLFFFNTYMLVNLCRVPLGWYREKWGTKSNDEEVKRHT